MKALFISDLHLSEDAPAILRAFDALLAGPARDVDALYILGDLFEYWAGDDDDTPLARHVAKRLQTLAQNGIPIFFLAGNRDFLIGDSYAALAGMRLLTEPTTIKLDGHCVLLSHGDPLCTDDTDYQAFRTMVRAPAWQASFLAKPLAERRSLIEDMRRHSQAVGQQKPTEIMDVNTRAVEELFRAYDCPTIIHGHTHRPARHVHQVDGRECVRWVLSDWRGEHAPYLLWDGSRGFIDSVYPSLR